MIWLRVLQFRILRLTLVWWLSAELLCKSTCPLVSIITVMLQYIVRSKTFLLLSLYVLCTHQMIGRTSRLRYSVSSFQEVTNDDLQVPPSVAVAYNMALSLPGPCLLDLQPFCIRLLKRTCWILGSLNKHCFESSANLQGKAFIFVFRFVFIILFGPVAEVPHAVGRRKSSLRCLSPPC